MRVVLTLAVVAAFVGCDSGHHDRASSDPAAKKALESVKTLPGADKVKDPVCGMTIAKGAIKADWDKADWFFCSEVCREKFVKEPAKYAKACPCATTMKGCDCTHCEGKREPCDCGEHK